MTTSERALELLKELTTEWHDTLSALEHPDLSLNLVYSLTLAGRSIGLLESSELLFKHGQIREAKILCRAFLECLFRLRAIEKDTTGDFASALIGSDQFHNLNRVKKIQDVNPQRLKSIETLETEVRQYEERTGKAAREISIYDIAEKAGVTGMYRTHYLMYTWSTHTNETELREFVDLDESGNVVGFNFKPSQEKLATEVLRLCNLSCISLISFLRIFQLDITKANAFEAKVDQLAQDISKENATPV